MHGDTIAAAATPTGISGLAVIRLSGPACVEVARRCLGRLRWQPRVLHQATFRDPDSGEALDSLTFHMLPGPNSPTGEDVLEIFPHGNPLLVESILRALLRLPGLRLPEPGEFTRRAFENGRMDLVQAEAVGELLQAQNRAALRNARRLLEGELSARLRELRDGLIDLSARLELDVDFAEEEADPDYASWRPRLEKARAQIETLLRGFERSRNWKRVPHVVIYGAPNAGKSSLINALVAQDRLLVSDIAGTTRDFVEVPLRLPSGIIHLVDTAGLGKPVDALDALAMDRTRGQMGAADLKIFVADGTGSQAPEDGDGADLRVRTKSDLAGFTSRKNSWNVSSQSGAGLEALLAELERRLFSPDLAKNEDADEVLLATDRQRHALENARDRLHAAEANLDTPKPAVEIVAFEAREACQALRELLGEMTPDAVLVRLFSGFCIGK